MQVRSRRGVAAGSRCGRIVAIVAAFSAFLLAACDRSPSEPAPELTWEAALAGSGIYEGVSGAASVTSSLQTFQIGIILEGAEPEQSYAWWVATGLCEEPGERVGAEEAYPAIETDAEGSAEAEATVTALLDPQEQYHLSVGFDGEDEVEIVACGVLELT